MKYVMLAALAGLLFLILNDYRTLAELRKKVRLAWSTMYSNVNEKNKILLKILALSKYFLYEEQAMIKQMTESIKSFKAPSTVGEKMQAERVLDDQLHVFFAKLKDQPGVSRSRDYFEYKNMFRATENRLESAVNNYNKIIRHYNQKIDSFPSNLIAKSLRFQKFPKR